MQSFPYKGQLITWKDDRGFGFIKPDDGSKEVFLHISALKGTGRRPIEGDTILYEKTTEANGKIRASKASIQGVSNQSTVSNQRSRNSRNSGQASHQQSTSKFIRKILPIVIMIGLGTTLVSPASNFIRSQFFKTSKQALPSTPVNSPMADTANSNCNIKGNISVNTGDKLYHLPNMRDYAITNINESNGEKWFCTESEAIASGWKKAPR